MAILKTILKQNGNTVLPKAQLNGIDTDNLLAEQNIVYSNVEHQYTATQDCVMYLRTVRVGERSPYFYVKIDGHIFDTDVHAENSMEFYIPLKKGQVISIFAYLIYYKVFGIK